MAAGQERPSFLSSPTASISAGGLDRARRLAWWDVQHTEQNQKLDASTDPTHSHWIHKFDLGVTFRLFYGRIVDGIAYANCYKVQVENAETTIWCSSATLTALQPMGARQLGQLPVGAGVILAMHPTDYSGIILGVIPDAQTAGNSAMADFISQQGRCGLLVDSAHSYPLTLDEGSLVADWSGGRPIDATMEGEFGHITETGLLDFIDSFMATKRVDEECGIWHFWHDQLTRLAGHNLQIWSAGYEREDLDDEGEVAIVEGYTPFYWEALGAFDSGIEISRDIASETWQKDPDNQAYSATEPLEDQQAPYYRLLKYHGYLGQAYKTHLSLPPDRLCRETDLNLLPDLHKYPGVFEENLALTGRWMVRSAHEIILSKHIFLPTPKRITLSEDPGGDNSTNYLAAGAQGVGPQHMVEGEIPVVDDAYESQVRAAGFLDTHAFVFNWIGAHPFYYHEQDWYLPEEAELDYLGDCAGPQFTPPEYDRLGCQQHIPAPEAIPLEVDHRYGEVKYYPNHSYFGLLADGGVVLGDGFGAEIRMTNGTLRITAPGDVVLEAGRDVISLAGFDLILRAKNSWDITATKRDGRLQANRKLMMAATGECGGILIQSKATYPTCDFTGEGEQNVLGGILLKAADSIVGIQGRHLSFKLSEDHPDNVITFDAGWEGRLKFKGQYVERFMTAGGGAMDYWVEPDKCSGYVTKGVEWWDDGVIIPMPVLINDRLLVAGCGVFKGNVVATEGHVVTSKARSTGGKVGQLPKVTEYESVFDDLAMRAHATMPEMGDTELINLCVRLEDFEFPCEAEFDFRTVEQYKTQDYVFFESRWQQIARLSSVPVQPWTEVEVNNSYPYPGKEILLGTTFRTLDLRLYDVGTGVAENRGNIYELPEFAEPVSRTLNTNYMVII